MKANGLGRNEYCIDAIAVSPPSMYSNADATSSFTQPRPVVVTTARVPRSNPPVRSNSSTTRCATPLIESEDSRPAYTRIGCFASRPVNAVISAAVGPLPMKVRPSWPSESQASADIGEPLRSAIKGCSMPSGVS